jgi:uncharacterized coiled-coil protein SlyX
MLSIRIFSLTGSVAQQITDVKRRQARIEARMQAFFKKVDNAIVAEDEELDTVVEQLECMATKWSETIDELNALLPANQRDDEKTVDFDDEIARYQRQATRILEAMTCRSFQWAESVLLRHMIYAILKEQNVILKAPSLPKKPEPVPVVQTGICIARHIPPATHGLRRLALRC